MSLDESYQVDGLTVNVRREDLRVAGGYPRHGKMHGLMHYMLAHRSEKGFACLASAGSDWALGLAMLAAELGASCRIYFGAVHWAQLPDWMVCAKAEYNAGVRLLRPNYLSILSAQAKAGAEAEGYTFLPFGMEDPIIVSDLVERLQFPEGASIILSAGSGITLACVLRSAVIHGRKLGSIFAISSGRSVAKIRATVKRYESAERMNGFVESLEVIHTGRYRLCHPDGESLWPVHPYYEAKAYDWLMVNRARLREPLWFLNM